MYKFCLTHKYNPKLEKINYINVGMGSNKFPHNWLLDNTGENISAKNKYYDMENKCFMGSQYNRP